MSELYSPVSGEVTEVNGGLADAPESVNADPHATWMIAIRLSNPDEVAGLLDSTQYAELAR